MLSKKSINSLLEKSLGLRVEKTRPIVSFRYNLFSKPDLEKIDIEKFLCEVKNAFDDSISVKRFIDSTKKSKPLFIALNKACFAIRIELPSKNFLHLHSVAIYDDCGNQIEAKNIKNVEFSSLKDINKITKKDYKNLFLTNGIHKRAFHTELEKKPWIQINLSRKTYVSGMLIKNIDNPRIANRATGLLVKTSLDLKKWITSYDFGGIDNFSRKVDRIVKRYGIDKCDYGPEMVEFIKLVIQGENIETKLTYQRMPEKYRKIIVKPMNDIILYDRKLELISHGPRKSFRFWTTSEKQKFIKLTMGIIVELKSLSPDVCLGFGSVLATHRDKDLMPHDDDTDTLIAFDKSQAPTMRAAQNIVKEHFEKNGYEVTNEGYSHCWVKKDGLKVDVFVGLYDEDGTVGWMPGPRGVLKRSDVFPAKKSKLLGIECEIPKNTEYYLEVTYGKDWKHPDPNHVHIWDKDAYRDISGVK